MSKTTSSLRERLVVPGDTGVLVLFSIEAGRYPESTTERFVEGELGRISERPIETWRSASRWRRSSSCANGARSSRSLRRA
jgi:hypothetical protein